MKQLSSAFTIALKKRLKYYVFALPLIEEFGVKLCGALYTCSLHFTIFHVLSTRELAL